MGRNSGVCHYDSQDHTNEIPIRQVTCRTMGLTGQRVDYCMLFSTEESPALCLQKIALGGNTSDAQGLVISAAKISCHILFNVEK